MKPVLFAVLLALVAGCGSDGQTESAAAPADRYEATATVLEGGGHGPELCLGGVATSYPPQCGGPPMIGWDWETVAGEERASGTIWGTYHVVGSYDGRTFTVEEAGPPERQSPVAAPDFSTPCGVPPGGWTAQWKGEEGLQDAVAYAQRQAGHVATWVTQLEPPREEASPRILNVVFRTEAAAHEAELRRRWSGPLCVVERNAPTIAELERVRSEAEALLQVEGRELLGSATMPHLSLVELSVVVDPGESLQQKLDDRFGPGRIAVVPALKPVG